jgi:hypothetical protein
LKAYRAFVIVVHVAAIFGPRAFRVAIETIESRAASKRVLDEVLAILTRDEVLESVHFSDSLCGIPADPSGNPGERASGDPGG